MMKPWQKIALTTYLATITTATGMLAWKVYKDDWLDAWATFTDNVYDSGTAHAARERKMSENGLYIALAQEDLDELFPLGSKERQKNRCVDAGIEYDTNGDGKPERIIAVTEMSEGGGMRFFTEPGYSRAPGKDRPTTGGIEVYSRDRAGAWRRSYRSYYNGADLWNFAGCSLYVEKLGEKDRIFAEGADVYAGRPRLSLNVFTPADEELKLISQIPGADRLEHSGDTLTYILDVDEARVLGYFWNSDKNKFLKPVRNRIPFTAE